MANKELKGPGCGSIWEVKVGKLGVEVHSWLYRESEACLNSRRLSQKQNGIKQPPKDKNKKPNQTKAKRNLKTEAKTNVHCVKEIKDLETWLSG